MQLPNIVTEIFSSPTVTCAPATPAECADRLQLVARHLPTAQVPASQQANLRQWKKVLLAHAESLQTESVNLRVLAVLELAQNAPYLMALLQAPCDISRESGEQLISDLVMLGAAAQWTPSLVPSEHARALSETHSPEELAGLWTKIIQTFSSVKLGRIPVRTLLSQRLNLLSDQRDCGDWLIGGEPRTAGQLAAQIVLARIPTSLRGELEPYEATPHTRINATLTGDLLITLHGARAWETALAQHTLQELRELAAGRQTHTGVITVYAGMLSGIRLWQNSHQTNEEVRKLRQRLVKLRDIAHDLEAVISAGEHAERHTLVRDAGLTYGEPPAHLNLTRLTSDEAVASAMTHWSMAVTARIVRELAPASWHALSHDRSQLLSGDGHEVFAYALTSPAPTQVAWSAQTVEATILQADEHWPTARALKA